MQSNTKPSLWWKRASYVLAVFLFVETSLQMFYRVTTGSLLIARDRLPIFAPDPFTSWTNQRNLSYRHDTPEFTAELYTNSQGFRVSSRHEEYDRGSAPDRFRILLLGPSFAFGWGVNYEETFGVQLQQLLTEVGTAGGAKIEVLNHGVPSQPPANNLEWFIHHGKEYAPNLVIQFVYGSLEVDAEPATSVVVRNGYLVSTTLGLRDRIWSCAKTSATVFYSGVIVTLVQKALSRQDGGGIIEGAGREMRNSRSIHAADSHVKESMKVYGKLKEFVEKTGAQLLIVHFPLSYVVHPEDRARWALQGVRDIDEQIEFNRAICAYLNEHRISCLNLTDDFIATAKTDKRRLYYWLDIHWTETGNALAAKLVAQYLTAGH